MSVIQVAFIHKTSQLMCWTNSHIGNACMLDSVPGLTLSLRIQKPGSHSTDMELYRQLHHLIQPFSLDNLYIIIEK